MCRILVHEVYQHNRNKKAAEIMEYDSTFVRGKNLVDDFITPDYRKSVNMVLRQALNGEESANFGK